MTALDHQVGGGHYKDMAIQPIEFIVANNLEYRVANCVKYLCRYKSKNGVEDLRKAKHYLEMLIEDEVDQGLGDGEPEEIRERGSLYRCDRCNFKDSLGVTHVCQYPHACEAVEVHPMAGKDDQWSDRRVPRDV